MRKFKFTRRRASSLVISLMVIAVLTIIVIAFLQSMSIEQKTASSYSNMLKARLAAEGALEQAISRIQSTFPTSGAALQNGVAVWTWGRDTNYNASYTGILPDIFDTSGPNQGVDRTVWLFSTTNPITNPDTITSATNEAFNVNADNRVNASTATIPVDWVTVASTTNNSGATNSVIRAAYWVSDEAGRLPISEIGNTTNATLTTGKIKDIKISSLPQNEINALDTNRAILSILKGQSFREIVPTSTNSPTSFSSLTKTNFNLVNYGGFFMQPRRDINALASGATNAAAFVSDFKNLVSRGLPFYAERKTMTNGQLERIAASIYDYIDTDSAPTMSPDLMTKFAVLDNVSSSWSDFTDMNMYYGIEGVPRLNEYLCYYGDGSEATTKWSSSADGTSCGVTRTFELWNMSDKPIDVTQIAIRVFNHQQGTTPFGGTPIPLSEETLTGFQPPQVSIPANGFVVIKHNKVYSSAGGPLSFVDFRAGLTTKPNGVVLSCSVNGAAPTVVDGFYPIELNGNAAGGKAGSSPGYSTSGNSADGRANLGRFLVKWASNTSAAHTPTLPNNTSASGTRLFQDMTTWFDRPLVGAPLNVSPAFAPAFIKNDKMEYIGELGNIFDPSRDIVEGDASRPRGTKTLAVGQFDPYFRVQEGQDSAANRDYSAYLKRADSALMDLFTVSDQARVNINSPRPKTEPNRPLVFFGNSLEQTNNAAFPQTSKPRLSASALEDVVINRLATTNWREARPIRNMNDLTTLGSSLTASPFQAGSNFWSSASSKIWQANAPAAVGVTQYGSVSFLPAISIPDGGDRAREEAMRRIANFVDFSSLAFRVYSSGQVKGPNGRVLARANLEAIVTFTPEVTKDPVTSVTTAVKYVPSVRFVSSD